MRSAPPGAHGSVATRRNSQLFLLFAPCPAPHGTHCTRRSTAVSRLKKIRARPQQRASLLIAFQLIARLDIKVLPIAHTEAIVLAEGARLTFYDACYLWLAEACHCELLTLDKKLATAARK